MKTFHSQSGFTLVEMIVALAVFSIVITISVGALLVLIVTNQQLQAEQSVMTNLSFALDSMTREIRTGTRYFCGAAGSRTASIGGNQIFKDSDPLSGMDEDTNDCYDGRGNLKIQGVAFIEGGQSVTNAPNTRIVYFFDENDHKLYRRIGVNDAEGEARSIVSSGIYIEDAEFFVTGSDPQTDNDDTQATVTIYVKAREASSTVPYELQTTITQRTLDI